MISKQSFLVNSCNKVCIFIIIFVYLCFLQRLKIIYKVTLVYNTLIFHLLFIFLDNLTLFVLFAYKILYYI